MSDIYYFTLHFSYQLLHDNDEVLIAQAIPYTYSDVIQLLKEVSTAHPTICRVENLCNTFANNKCPIMVVTENSNEYIGINFFRDQLDKSGTQMRSYLSKIEKMKRLILSKKLPKKECEPTLSEISLFEKKMAKLKEDYYNNHLIDSIPIYAVSYIKHTIAHKNKKYIVLSARVHPGEIPGSWMMHGIIKFLVSNEASALRHKYIFVVIPMLNPDGVRYGNYRCSLVGHDLNRKWLSPNKYLHPEIYYLKNLIKLLQKERPISLYCDLHGHFRKHNVFMYGCSYKSSDSNFLRKNAQIRVIPLIFSQKNECFSYKESEFHLEKEKETTARVVLFKEYGIKYAYTCEATFYGASGTEQQESKHMNIRDYMLVGEDLCKVISCISNKDLTRSLIANTMAYLRERYYLKCANKPMERKFPIDLNEKIEDIPLCPELNMEKLMSDLKSTEAVAKQENDCEQSDNDISSTDSEDNLNLLLKEKRVDLKKKIRSITIRKKAKRRNSSRGDSPIKMTPEVSPMPTRNLYIVTQPSSINKPKILGRTSKNSIIELKNEEKKIYGNELSKKKFTSKPKHIDATQQKKEDDILTNFTQLCATANQEKKVRSIVTRSLAIPLISDQKVLTDNLYVAKNSLFKKRRNDSKDSITQDKPKLTIIGMKKEKMPYIMDFEKFSSIYSKQQPPILKKAESMNQESLVKQCIGLLMKK
jgi:hypothetical protein